MAVPSAKNSGFDNTEKLFCGRAGSCSAAARIAATVSAVRTGRVLFSTTIVWPVAAAATWRVQASIQRKSDAWPAPTPLFFVGVLTDRNTISALAIA